MYWRYSISVYAIRTQGASITAVIPWNDSSSLLDSPSSIHRWMTIQWYPSTGHHDSNMIYACSACDPCRSRYLRVMGSSCLHWHAIDTTTVSCCWVSTGKPWHEEENTSPSIDARGTLHGYRRCRCSIGGRLSRCHHRSHLMDLRSRCQDPDTRHPGSMDPDIWVRVPRITATRVTTSTLDHRISLAMGPCPRVDITVGTGRVTCL